MIKKLNLPANIAIVDQARDGKGCAIVHSDDEVGIQHLNQEAAKALSAASRLALELYSSPNIS